MATKQKVVARIDWTVPGVGRLRVRLEKYSTAQRAELLGMFTRLAKDGSKFGVLRLLRDGKLTVPQLYEAFLGNRLDDLAQVDSLPPLRDTWLKWCEQEERAPLKSRSSKGHLAQHRYTLSALEAVGGKSARVGDLRSILAKLKEKYRSQPRSFNLFMSHASAMVKAMLGSDSELYVKVCALGYLKYVRARDPKTLTVAQVHALARKLEPEAARAFWSMCTTGMIPKEYWVDGWEVMITGPIQVHGQKRGGRERVIPNLGRCAEPELSQRQFAYALSQVDDGDVKPKDCRNIFMHWMEQARVTRSRRKLYMGHRPKDVSDLYEWHEVLEYCVADTAVLREYIEAQEREQELTTPDMTTGAPVYTDSPVRLMDTAPPKTPPSAAPARMTLTG